MTGTRLGVLLVLVGGVVVFVSVLADPLGLGGNNTSFGWKQTVGVVAGAALMAAGALLVYAARRREAGEPSETTA